MNETNRIAARAFVEAMRGSLPKAAYAKIRDEAALRLGISIADAGEFPGESGARLVPVLGRMKKNGPVEYRYALGKCLPENMFPVNTTKPSDGGYAGLFETIGESLDGLKNKAHPSLWFEHFESLMSVWLSLVPATPSEETDISLYDHCKIAAALAVADYLYENGETGNRPGKKYLFVSGGITGIQRFIFEGYGESRANRSKLLRGRSLAVSLMSELAAVLVCENAGLPSVSIIFNAAGRFTILGPNTEKMKAAVREAEQTITKWLVKHTHGETGFTLVSAGAAEGDLEDEKPAALFEKIGRRNEEKKFQRIDLNEHGGVVGGYLGTFGGNRICQFCGKRAAHVTIVVGDEEKHFCKLCRDHGRMGEKVVKKPVMAVFDRGEGDGETGLLMEPVFGKYQVEFFEDAEDEWPQTDMPVKLWGIGIPLREDIAARPIGGYVPIFDPDDAAERELVSLSGDKGIEKENSEHAPKTLNLIALKAKAVKTNEKGGKSIGGTDALGVLKADVDNLGELMSKGLGESVTLSRMASASRQMNAFFSVLLPRLLQTEYPDVYTVFAGGDDLMLIGPWNVVVDLAREIRKQFSDYVCGNKNVHISAGISFHKGHTPVDRMAEASESELEKSKEENDDEKDRVTLFSETMRWNEFENLEAGTGEIEDVNTVRAVLEEWLEEGTVNQAMLFRLDELIRLAADEARINGGGDIRDFRDMSCAKWRSWLAYTAARNVAKREPKEKRGEIIERTVNRLAHWLETHRGKMKVPVWQILYERR